MSVKTNGDAFRENIRQEIKKIQEELDELKKINQSNVKKVTSKKSAKKSSTKRESVKSKPVKSKPVKSKPVRKVSKSKKANM